MTEIKLTHKGMYGICPIYLSIDGICVEERSRLFTPLFWLMDFFFFGFYAPMYAVKYGETPSFCYKITGELKEPIVRQYPDEWDFS